jgi:hypothetical protein
MRMWASTADRDRAIDVLKTAFVEGRLTSQELDLRVGQVFGSRFFGELMTLTADLPAGVFGRLPAHPATPAFRRTRTAAATAALVLALIAVIAAVWALLPA